MGGEARKAALDVWMQAGLLGGDWLGPLGASAKLLGARAVALVWSESEKGRTMLDVSPGAPAELLRLCREFAKAPCGGFVEHEEPGLGRVVWTKSRPDAVAAGEFVFAALFDRAADRDLFLDIAGFAATSVATRSRLSAVRATSALKTAAFDQLPFGVVIVDRDLRVAEPNEACRQILSQSDGLSLARDRLHCREPADQAALFKAVASALDEATASVVKVRRKRAAESYVLRIVAPRASAKDREHCLLMIVNPDEDPPSCGDIWRAMFDLTDCELIIAEGLVNGRRINDIAHQRGVSVETVRTQTKRMFERLNVSSQAEAAARLSRTSPFRLAPAEPCGLVQELA